MNAFSAEEILMNTSTPDLIDIIWTDRPPTQGTSVEVYPMEFAGEEWTVRLLICFFHFIFILLAG